MCNDVFQLSRMKPFARFSHPTSFLTKVGGFFVTHKELLHLGHFKAMTQNGPVKCFGSSSVRHVSTTGESVDSFSSTNEIGYCLISHQKTPWIFPVVHILSVR